MLLVKNKFSWCFLNFVKYPISNLMISKSQWGSLGLLYGFRFDGVSSDSAAGIQTNKIRSASHTALIKKTRIKPSSRLGSILRFAKTLNLGFGLVAAVHCLSLSVLTSGHFLLSVRRVYRKGNHPMIFLFLERIVYNL